MQRNATLFLYALGTTILLLGNCCYAHAYVALPEVAAAAARATDSGLNPVATSGTNALAEIAAGTKSHAKHMAELMAATYPDRPAAAASNYLNDVSGSFPFQPPQQLRNELNGRAAVYDPGDELLRALNAEIAANGQELGTLPEEPDYADTVFNELEVANKYEMLRKLEGDLRAEQEVVTKSTLLMKMLEDPNIQTLPVIYVEEDDEEPPAEDIDVGDNNLAYPLGGMGAGVAKRSRYYRRYPWKRHNRNRSTYEPELRYACTPTKEDVFKLLINLHENRKGNHSKTVNFCNRKRPAKSIFTNIRFLG